MKLKEELIQAAIDGFTAQKLRIDAEIAELRAMLTGSSNGTVATPDATPPQAQENERCRQTTNRFGAKG